MPLNQSYVGHTYPKAAPYQVGREKIREFAGAIGATDPLYHDPDAARAAGYPDVIAPPTFPIVVTFSATRSMVDDPGLGLDYHRVVHGDQRFAYTRPVTAGDVLTCETTIEEIVSRGGHDFLTSRTEVRAAGGEPVVTAWSKLVVR